MTNKPSKEFEEMVKANEWHTDLNETIDTTKSLLSSWPDWSWYKNQRCKYIDIRIDMRNGGHTIRDRNGERISLDQLKWQYKAEQNDQ